MLPNLASRIIWESGTLVRISGGLNTNFPVWPGNLINFEVQRLQYIKTN